MDIHKNRLCGFRSFSLSGRCETTDDFCSMPAEGARLIDRSLELMLRSHVFVEQGTHFF